MHKPLRSITTRSAILSFGNYLNWSEYYTVHSSIPVVRMVGHGQPIILPGFDRDRQSQCDFGSSMFNTFWLRRVYTHEGSHLIKNPGRHTPQEIRFGNNITVLLKACNHLRGFYNHPLFWGAVANGFGSMSDEIARERALAFLDARSIFLSRGGSPDYVSAATRAADDFIAFVELESISQHHSPVPTGDPRAIAASFFSSMRESLVDSARVTFDGETQTLAYTSARFASEANPRKRSPSPSPPGQSSCAKRRQLSDFPDRSDTSGQARAPQSLPPLVVGKKIRGTAKQESCQTPSTAQDRPTPDGSFSQGTLDKPAELRIRGTAPVEKGSQSPSIAADDGTMEAHTLSYEDLRHANIKLQVRVHALEREKEKREEASKAMNTKFALLEQRMNAFEARPAQDDKPIQTMENKYAFVDEKLQEVYQHLADKDKGTTIQELKNRVQVLEGKLWQKPLRTDNKAIQDLEHMVDSLVARMTTTEFKIDAEIKAVVTTVAALETRANTPNGHGCDSNASQKTLMERLERQITSLQTKVASIETRREPGNRIDALDNKINALQENMKAVQEMANEQPLSLKDLLGAIRHRPTIEAVAKQIEEMEQAIHDLIETCTKALVERVKDSCQSVRVAAVRESSIRIDKVAEDLAQMNRTLQIVYKIPELSETINGILNDEMRLAIPANLNDLAQRVTIVERILRNLRDAY